MKKIIVLLLVIVSILFTIVYFDKGEKVMDFITTNPFTNINNMVTDSKNQIVDTNTENIKIDKINKIKIHKADGENYNSYVPVIMVKSYLDTLKSKLTNLTKIDYELNDSLYPYIEIEYNDGLWGEIKIINENTIGIKYDYDNNFYMVYKLNNDAQILTYINSLYNN